MWTLRCVCRRQCRQRGGSVVQLRATRRASAVGGLVLSRPQRTAESAQRLRCGAATAGKGFGAQEEDDYDEHEWDDDVEEVDFGYAAEVVRETWELFAETGPDEQVGRLTIPLPCRYWQTYAASTLSNTKRSDTKHKPKTDDGFVGFGSRLGSSGSAIRA